MAVKSPKQVVETNTQPELPTPDAIAFDLEGAIADSLLGDIDWSRVKTAMFSKAKAKFWHWLTSGNNTPINISAFPELSALPSSQDGEAA
jgi:hypothetical protein